MARRSQRFRKQRRIEKRKAREEAELVKVIEDNSVMLEQMKTLSRSVDNVLQNLDTEPEPLDEMKIQPYNEPSLVAPESPNLKKMLKRELIVYAKENNVTVRPTMTKTQIIKAIEEA